MVRGNGPVDSANGRKGQFLPGRAARERGRRYCGVASSSPGGAGPGSAVEIRPEPNPRPGFAYQPGLDGVRALAVLAVLAYHDGRLRGGFLGVSTFFTLSGFLITGLLLAEWRATGRVSFGGFYARRARRLLPAAIVGLLLAAAITPALHDPSVSHAFRGDALAALFDVANWRFLAAGRSYGALFTLPSPLLHFWSLAVEEQFYLVLVPVLVGLLALARGRRRLLGAAIAFLAIASLADGWIAVRGGSVDRVFDGTDTRALEFLVGALLAFVLAGRVVRGARRVPSPRSAFLPPASCSG